MTPPEVKGSVIVIADSGRAAAADIVDAQLRAGHRVMAVDLYNFGESKTSQRPSLFAIAVSSVGERPLGIQSSQLAAVARWMRRRSETAPPSLLQVRGAV